MAAPNASGLTPAEFVSFKLAARMPHTHNTEIYTFALASAEAAANLPVSSCVMTRCKDPAGGADIIRPYTPINTHEAGKLHLLIKCYEAGKMSKHIHGLSIGDALEIKGPMAKLKYEANKYREIGMIAGGTGITPMVQVADEIFRNADDKTKVVLIVSQSTLRDVLLRDKLDAYTAQRGDQFRVIHVVTQQPKPADGSAEWVQEWGRLTRATLEKYLPAPAADSFTYTCGPPAFMAAVSGDKQPDKSQGPLVGLLKDMGWEADHVCKQ